MSIEKLGLVGEVTTTTHAIMHLQYVVPIIRVIRFFKIEKHLASFLLARGHKILKVSHKAYVVVDGSAF